MSTLSAAAVLLALCACSMAAVNMDRCARAWIQVESAKDDKALRKNIEKVLGEKLKDDDLLTNFVLYDNEDEDAWAFIVFVGRNGVRKAAAFEYNSDDEEENFRLDRWNETYHPISMTQYFQYLQCEIFRLPGSFEYDE